MAGIEERIEESKNWFERLLERVPLFRDYRRKEIQREADKIQRSHMAERLGSCLGRLDDVKADLLKSGTVEGLDEIDVTMRKLRKVMDRIVSADYGYAGLFDPTKVGEAQLDQLFAFDKALETEVGSIGEFAAALAVSSPSLRTDVGLLQDRLDMLDARFSERERIITGAGR